MTLEQLYKFCGDRSGILRPWTRGGFTWATNGRILVRCLEPAVPDNLAAPDTRKLFDLYPQPDRWSALGLPDTEPTIACDSCSGTGRKKPCPDCKGCGVRAVSASISDGRNSGRFSLVLLHMIADNIPDAEICILDNRGPFLWFRSEGVFGILLGLKEKEGE